MEEIKTKLKALKEMPPFTGIHRVHIYLEHHLLDPIRHEGQTHNADTTEFMDDLIKLIVAKVPTQIEQSTVTVASQSGLTSTRCKLFINKLATAGLNSPCLQLQSQFANTPIEITTVIAPALVYLEINHLSIAKSELVAVVKTKPTLRYLGLVGIQVIQEDGSQLQTYDDDDELIVALRNMSPYVGVRLNNSHSHGCIQFTPEDKDWIRKKAVLQDLNTIETEQGFLMKIVDCDTVYRYDFNYLGAIFEVSRACIGKFPYLLQNENETTQD